MTETDPQYQATTDFEVRKVPYPNIKRIVTLFFILLLIEVLVAIPTGFILAVFPHISPLLKSFLNTILYIVSMLLIINYALGKSKQQQGYTTSINFARIQGWLVPVIIIGTLSLIVPLTWLSDLIPMPNAFKKMFEGMFTKDAVSIATVSIAAPIMEEVLCRGIILKGLLKNYSPFKAIFISAIFFSVIHLNPWQALPALIGGLYMGWVYYKTQSVIPGIIIHATINFTASMLLFLPGPEQDLSTFIGMNYYILALVASGIIFAAICIVIHKKAEAGSVSVFNRNYQPNPT